MLKLFNTTAGNLILFGVLLGGTLLWYFFKNMEAREFESMMNKVPDKEYQQKPIEITRKRGEFIKRSPENASSYEKPRIREQKSLNVHKNAQKQKKKRKHKPAISWNSSSEKPSEKQKWITINKKTALALDLYTSEEPQEHELSLNYAPYGRLIPCETVITIDSSKIDTPVIAMVTEDVYHNGRLIIPAGAEVHGKAATNRSRQRLEASGSWVIVWRDKSTLNGSELKLSGIALDRNIDLTKGKWGIDDGSAGLKGRLIKSDSWAEIRLFAAQFISAFSNGLEDKKTISNFTGETERVSLDSTKNALLQGSRAVIDRYADQILQQIEDDGFYVRVRSGTQFYLYVTETIDLGQGSRGNELNREIWSKEKDEKNS